MLLIIGAPDPMVFCPPGNSTGSPLMCIELPSFRRISLPLGPHRYTKNPQESLDYPLPWATRRRHLNYECLSPDYFSCPGRPQLHFPHKTVAPKSAIKGNCRDLPRNIHVTKALVKGGLEQHSRVCSAGEDQSGIQCKQNLGKKSVRRERERRGREGCGSNRGNSGRTWGRGEQAVRKGAAATRAPKATHGPGSGRQSHGMQGPRTQGASLLQNINGRSTLSAPRPEQLRRQTPEGKAILWTWFAITSNDLKHLAAQSVLCRPAVWASPGSFTARNLRPRPGPTGAKPAFPPEAQEGGASNTWRNTDSQQCFTFRLIHIQALEPEYAPALCGGLVKTYIAGPTPEILNP